ncbi:MAG: response regulator [Magnetococcales bacterium]|nr:response regulator [Magnetococcales bacterium]
MESKEKKAKILIVDDVPANIKTLAEILKDDCQILMATSGAKALEAVAIHTVDLILLDVVMPGMDGYEVCKRLKEDKSYAEIPVIFVTSNHDKKAMVKGIVAGAIYYLTKPIDKDELRKLVKNILQMSDYFSPQR